MNARLFVLLAGSCESLSQHCEVCAFKVKAGEACFGINPTKGGCFLKYRSSSSWMMQQLQDLLYSSLPLAAWISGWGFNGFWIIEQGLPSQSTTEWTYRLNYPYHAYFQVSLLLLTSSHALFFPAGDIDDLDQTCLSNSAGLKEPQEKCFQIK